MTKSILFFILLFFSVSAFGQLFVDKKGLQLFENGTVLLENGNFLGADSLLSLAMCSFKNENVYYNRGISRLLQSDTLGFCEDIGIAANKYFDTESASLYNKLCCSYVDTIYYDRKFKQTSEKNYRYYEIIRKSRYNKTTTGVVHDIKSEKVKFNIDYGCVNNLIDISYKTTDIIAVYEIKDLEKYYRYCPKPVTVYNSDKYRNLISKAKKFLQIKYGDLKTENNIEELTVVFEITVASSGDILGVKYVGIFPEIQIGEIEEELELDLMKIVNNYPKVTPASFKKEKVNFIILDLIKY